MKITTKLTDFEYLKMRMKLGKFNPYLYSASKHLSELSKPVQDRVIKEYLKHPTEEVKWELARKEYKRL